MIIPLGMVGLVQVTRTVLLLIAMTALMTGALEAFDHDKINSKFIVTA